MQKEIEIKKFHLEKNLQKSGNGREGASRVRRYVYLPDQHQQLWFWKSLRAEEWHSILLTGKHLMGLILKWITLA